MEEENVHILLVEGNEGNILLMKEALEDSSISAKISVVRDGEKAVRFLEKESELIEIKNPDLIILDINIFKKNGFEVLKNTLKMPLSEYHFILTGILRSFLTTTGKNVDGFRPSVRSLYINFRKFNYCSICLLKKKYQGKKFLYL